MNEADESEHRKRLLHTPHVTGQCDLEAYGWHRLGFLAKYLHLRGKVFFPVSHRKTRGESTHEMVGEDDGTAEGDAEGCSVGGGFWNFNTNKPCSIPLTIILPDGKKG